MPVEDEELGPAVGRMLVTVFEAIEEWSRRERASREIPIVDPALEKLFKVPLPLPLISNVVVRKEPEAETIAWVDLGDRKYTLKREYLVHGNPLISIRDSFSVRLSLFDQGEQRLFMVTNPGEVGVFAPGRWVEDFLRLFEAISEQSHGEAAEAMLKICRLGYWAGEEAR